MEHKVIYKSASCAKSISDEEYRRNRDIANRENLKLRDYIIKTSNGMFRCEMCKEVNSVDVLELHHRVRIADGGSPFRDNIMCICKDCHNMLHNRTKKHIKYDIEIQMDFSMYTNISDEEARILNKLNQRINELVNTCSYKDIGSKVISLIEHAESDICK